jgi:hypothetical protein
MDGLELAGKDPRRSWNDDAGNEETVKHGKDLLTLGSAAQEHIGVDRGRGEKDVRKDEFARNETGNPRDEHETDDDVAFDAGHDVYS